MIAAIAEHLKEISPPGTAINRSALSLNSHTMCYYFHKPNCSDYGMLTVPRSEIPTQLRFRISSQPESGTGTGATTQHIVLNIDLAEPNSLETLEQHVKEWWEE
jgi:hypothetical protein